MYGLSEENWKKWQTKRRKTLIGFTIIGTAIGIDCSIIFNTLFYYLKTIVAADKVEIWFGTIVAFFYISSTFSGAICGRFVDRTRRVRFYVNIILILQIVGFLLYMMRLHPTLLLAGRIICGTGEPFISVISGEIFRIHTQKESTRAILILASVYSFGFIIGPLLNFLFLKVDFHLGSLHIDYTNFVGLFMASAMVILLIVAYFLISDCSMELDIKAYLHKDLTTDEKDFELKEGAEKSSSNEGFENENCDITIEGEVKRKNEGESEDNFERLHKKKPVPIKVVLKSLLSNKDTLLIFVAAFSFIYAIFTASTLLSLIVPIILKWGIKPLTYIFAGYGVIDLIVLSLMAKYVRTNKGIYVWGIVCMISQLIMFALVMAINLLPRNLTVDIVIMTSMIICMVFGWCFDEVLIRVLFANLVPSEIQSFSETLRGGLSRLGMIAGSFTSGVVIPCLHWWALGVLIMLVFLLISFLFRAKHLINPVLISLKKPTNKDTKV